MNEQSYLGTWLFCLDDEWDLVLPSPKQPFASATRALSICCIKQNRSSCCGQTSKLCQPYYDKRTEHLALADLGAIYEFSPLPRSIIAFISIIL